MNKLKLNIGDLIQVKKKNNFYWQDGIGYIKEKRKKDKTYSTWIVIQWMDEPQEQHEYTEREIIELMPDWLVYHVRK